MIDPDTLTVDEIAYAAGLALLSSTQDVPDALLVSAVRFADPGDRVSLTPDRLVEDGWMRDEARGVWIVPPREAPKPEPAGAPDRVGGPEVVFSTRDPRTMNEAELAAEIIELQSAAPPKFEGVSDAELDRMLDRAAAAEAERADPARWRKRWDRRVLALGRAVQDGELGRTR